MTYFCLLYDLHCISNAPLISFGLLCVWAMLKTHRRILNSKNISGMSHMGHIFFLFSAKYFLKQFFKQTSEQHRATVDLVNVLLPVSSEHTVFVSELMVIIRITFQQGCELQKHLQRHNVQDGIKILRNVENVQLLILGLKDLTLNPWAPK